MAKKKFGRKRVKRQSDMDRVRRKVFILARGVVKEAEVAGEAEVPKAHEEQIWVTEVGKIEMMVMTNGAVGKKLT